MAEFRHIKGYRELAEFLTQFPPKMEANIMRAAMRRGGNVIAETARANVPKLSGDTANGIKVGTRLTRGNEVRATVKSTDWKSKWLEYGTKPHWIAASSGKALSIGGVFVKGVLHPGADPKPYMVPAMDTRAQDALVAVGEGIKARLTKEGLNASHITVEGDE